MKIIKKTFRLWFFLTMIMPQLATAMVGKSVVDRAIEFYGILLNQKNPFHFTVLKAIVEKESCLADIVVACVTPRFPVDCQEIDHWDWPELDHSFVPSMVEYNDYFLFPDKNTKHIFKHFPKKLFSFLQSIDAIKMEWQQAAKFTKKVEEEEKGGLSSFFNRATFSGRLRILKNDQRTELEKQLQNIAITSETKYKNFSVFKKIWLQLKSCLPPKKSKTSTAKDEFIKSLVSKLPLFAPDSINYADIVVKTQR